MQVWAGIEEQVRHHNQERLHQGIRFVATVERHEGRDVAIIEARKLGLVEARRNRSVANRLGEVLDQQLEEHSVR